MSIATEVTRIQNAKTSLKSAINSKGGSLTNEKIDSYAAAVSAIVIGTDVSDTTAVASDVLSGKVFHLSNGIGTTGTIATVVQPVPAATLNASTGLVTASYTPISGYVSDTTIKSGTLQLTTKGAATYTPTTTNQTIASGKYLTGTQTISGDTNLTSENIAQGVSIFGVAGTHQGKSETVTQPAPTVTLNSSTGVITASYTPVAGDVSDTTVKSANLNLITQPAQTITPTTSAQTIASGKYLTGTQTISGDANLTAANIANGVTIFGVTGTHQGGTDVSDTTAVASDVLSGKVFHLSNGTSATGTITSKSAHTYTPGTTNQTISAGQYLSGTQTISGDVNLTSENIAQGVSIFGVAGTHQGGESASAGYFTNSNGTVTFTPVGGSAEAVSSIYLPDTGQPEPAYTGVTGIVFNGPSATATSVQVIPPTFTSGCMNFSNMFQRCTSLTTVPNFDTSSGTNFSHMFRDCTYLTTVPNFDTSSCTDFNSMFYDCTSLTTVPNFDTSSGTDFSYMFRGCTSLTTVPNFDTSSGTNFNSMFYNCRSLTTVPNFDTSSGTYFNSMFYNCRSLTTVPNFDTSSGTNFSDMFYNCSSLTTFGGLLNCKKSYNLSYSTLLTHESLMNAINGLYDLTGQTSQRLTLGSTNLAKLTDAEKAIATNKNWTLA